MNIKYNYICKICNNTFEHIIGFNKHLKKLHNITSKEYYDKYLKLDINEGKCIHCGKETKFYGINKGYTKYCSTSCINYERDYSSMANVWKNKTPEELEERRKHYRKIWSLKNKNELDNINTKRKITKKEKYGDENWNNANKMIETKIKIYGEDHFKNISKQIWDNMTPQKLNDRKQKTIETCQKKYNRDYPYNHEKSKKTKKEKYNDENYCNIEAIKQHFTDKFGEGITNPAQVPEIHKKMTAKYEAPNGKTYDSSWEYKFEQYLIENHIQYEYQPKTNYKWIDINGKEHFYYPDFKIITENSEEFIEIKGDYFFDENGKFYNPYDRTVEGYANAERKWNYMVEHNIKVYTSKELLELGIKIE